MRQKKPGVFLMAIATLVLGVCASQAAELVIPGSGNPEFILGKLAQRFNETQDAFHVSVPPSTGTAGALRSIENGEATLARVGRPLKDTELRTGIRYVPIGRDPIVFVGGQDVTVRNVTGAQVLAIYSGRITDWSELGGEPAPIRAIGREVTDASRTAIGKHLHEFASMPLADSVKLVHLDPHMISLLDRYPTSLGFLNRSGLQACTTPVVHLAYDSIEPSAQNVADGRYPFWTEFGLVYEPGRLTKAGQAFLDFITSPKGREVLLKYGITPTP